MVVLVNEMPDIKVLIEGGKASPAAPLGPALGPLGVNVMDIVNAVNEKTKAFTGVKVPVIISIDLATKNYEIEVGSPPTSALILKELKIEKGAKTAGLETVGDLKIEQVKKVAEMKMVVISSDLKKAMKEVAGTCVSMGVTIEGKHPTKVIKEIQKGKFDELIKAKTQQ